RVAGAVRNIDDVRVDAAVDRLEMTLFDYDIRIPRPIRLTMEKQVVRVEDFQLEGDETQLSIDGLVSLGEWRIALKANGDANLGILQGFLPNVRGAGRASLRAAVDCPLEAPLFSGNATV